MIARALSCAPAIRDLVSIHHNLVTYRNAWIKAAGIAGDNKGSLFRAIRKGHRLIENPMARKDVLAMIKRRAAATALPLYRWPSRFLSSAASSFWLMPRSLRRRVMNWPSVFTIAQL